MDGYKNTIAGWILAAAIAALGLTIFFGEIFHSEAPEEGKQGFAIEAEASGEGGDNAAAAVPIANALADALAADGIANGEKLFKKCTSCHTVDQGGANGIGPNLWATPGKPLASHAGFPYSDALKGAGGTWTFETLNKWLISPKKFAPGNKMSFAGLGKVEERAAIMLYLNSKGSNLPLPPPQAAAPAGAEGAAGAAAAGEGADAPAANAPADISKAPAADKAPAAK